MYYSVYLVLKFTSHHYCEYRHVCLQKLTPSYTGPAGYPPGIKAKSKLTTAITFSWKQLPCWQQNGPISGYEIHLYQGRKLQFSDRIMGSDSTNYKADDLRPGTEYGFKLAAINDAGRGEFSPILEIHTRRRSSLFQCIRS